GTWPARTMGSKGGGATYISGSGAFVALRVSAGPSVLSASPALTRRATSRTKPPPRPQSGLRRGRISRRRVRRRLRRLVLLPLLAHALLPGIAHLVQFRFLLRGQPPRNADVHLLADA